jgi:hypothetical protein
MVFQAIFLSQIITVSFQSTLASRRLRDTLGFLGIFVIMFVWAALQLWVFGNLGSREALLARVSEGNLPPILAGRVLSDPTGARGLGALVILTLETAATFVVGVLVSHFFFVMRVPSRAAARKEQRVALPRLPLSDHGNLLLWKDRIYLRRDPFVKAAAYGTLVLVLVALVASASTRISDPHVAGGFFLAIFTFLAPWTFLSGLGANVFGVEEGLPFLLATPIDRRAFLRAKAVFLVGLSTGVSALTLSACAVLFGRLDLLPTALAFAFLISVGLTAAALVSSAYFPTQAVREGFRRKTVSGLGLATFSLVGILFLVPAAIASGLPTAFGDRALLLVTVPAALAVELAFLRAGVEIAFAKISRDEGEVLLRVKG